LHQATSAEEVAAVIAGTAPRGFRFAVTKPADEQAPPGVDKQIFDAAEGGKLDELLGLCQQWAGHTVIDEYNDGVSQDTNMNTYTNICSLTCSPNKHTNKRIMFVSLLRVVWHECLDRCCW
jgi:hypothetical protein